MSGRWRRPVASAAATAVLATATAAGAAGCSNENTPSGVASKAASALSSVGAQATAAIASATEAAEKKLDEIKNGVDARGEVTLGTPKTGSDGITTVEVTVRNTAGSAKSFAVQVNYRDQNGNLLDTVVVTVPDVPASGSKSATARGTHKLSGEVKAEVGTALRY
ncbi:FxLYD domain-containing protein [Streptomyces sp. NPDC004609]|uniref:FxLYD domain-containing protein n=1 Tax=Streptomyces sp. NPDC004609 TaxID=3364704 RepID=UPI0036B542F3